MQSSPWLHAEPVRLSTTEFEPLTVLLGNRRVLTNVNCELSQPIWYQLKPIDAAGSTDFRSTSARPAELRGIVPEGRRRR